MAPSAAAAARAAAYLREPDAGSQVQFAARRIGADQEADRLTFEGGLPWSASWILPVEEDPHRTIAALGAPIVDVWTGPGTIGALAASGAYGVWRRDSGEPVIAGHAPGASVGAVACGGRHVLVVARRGRLRLHEHADGALHQRDVLNVDVDSLRAVTTDAGEVVLVGVEKTVAVSDWSMMDTTTTGGRTRCWAVVGDPVRLVERPVPTTDPAPTPGLLTGGRDGVVRLREVEPGPAPVPFATPTAAVCAKLADGRAVAVVAHDNQRIGVWDLDEGAPPESALPVEHDVAAIACLRVPDGRQLVVTGGLDGRLHVLDLDRRTHLRTVVMPVADPLPGTGGYRLPGVQAPPPGPEPIRGVAATVHSDGRPIVVTIGGLGWLRWWCPLTGEALGATALNVWGRGVVAGPGPGSIVVTANHPELHMGRADGPGDVRQLRPAEQLWAVGVVDDFLVGLDEHGRLHRRCGSDDPPLDGHYGDARALACGHHPDGSPIAVTGGMDGVVRVWDLRSGTQLHRIPVEKPVSMVALGDGGAVVIGFCGGLGVIRLHAR